MRLFGVFLNGLQSIKLQGEMAWWPPCYAGSRSFSNNGQVWVETTNKTRPRRVRLSWLRGVIVHIYIYIFIFIQNYIYLYIVLSVCCLVWIIIDYQITLITNWDWETQKLNIFSIFLSVTLIVTRPGLSKSLLLKFAPVVYTVFLLYLYEDNI